MSTLSASSYCSPYSLRVSTYNHLKYLHLIECCLQAHYEGSLAGCLVHLDAGSTTRLAQQNYKFPSMLVTGHYPANFLMLVYLLESNKLTSSCPDAILVTPLPTKKH